MTPEWLAALHDRANDRLRPWSAQEFAALLASPHVLLISGPNSFALGRVVADEAELLTIATDPGHRRQGYAKTRLNEFDTAARERGAKRAFLEVDADNRAAISLYQHNNYETLAQRPAYYSLRDGTRADALVMAKSLER